MIRIHRPPEAPEILRARGKDRRRAHSLSYTRNPQAYDAGERLFAFASDIYGHVSVKAALRAMQHDKCAFCESKVSHVAYGDVEHFRPKAGFRQHPGDALGRPGYYWLAYEWTNLFFACQLCNQRFKRNRFPLQDPLRRALNHRQNLAAEQPVFIDPSAEGPAAFIAFRGEVVYGKDAEGRGESTWQALGLNRAELVERRRDRLDLIGSLLAVVRLAPERPNDPEFAALAQEAERQIAQAAADDAEYSAMIRSLLA
jgi:uncharacterized protein (TIGR02646 family)